MRTRNDNRGQSLVELMVAIGLLGLVVLTLVSYSAFNASTALHGEQLAVARTYANEGMEAARAIRDRGWRYLTLGDHGTTTSSGYWEFSGAADSLESGQYVRTVSVTAVQRDLAGDIVQSGGVNDPRTRFVEVLVEWTTLQGTPVSHLISTYLTNWFVHEFFHTNPGDWSPGTFANVNINGSGDAASLQLTETEAVPVDFSCPVISDSINLDDQGFGDQPDEAEDVFVRGQLAYVVSDENDDDGTILTVWDFSDPGNVTSTASITLDLSDSPNTVVVAGDYAYVGMDGTSPEMYIVDVSTTSTASLAASFDIPSGSPIYDLHVDAAADRLYVGMDEDGDMGEFRIYDISSPTSPALVGEYEVDADVNGVFVDGDNAYLATNDNSAEFQLVDISTESAPTLADTYDIPTGPTEAIDVVGADGYAYMVTVGHGAADELYVLDVTPPTNVTLATSINVLDSADDIMNELHLDTANGLLFLALDENAESEAYVYDVSDPTAPTLNSQIEFDNDAEGVHGNVGGDLIVFALDTDGSTTDPHLAFITDNTDDLSCIDLRGELDLTGSANANDVDVSGDYAYLVRDSSSADEFVVVSVTDKQAPAVVGSLDLGATGYRVAVSGSHAYVATAGDELMVIDISTPSAPTVAGSLNLSGGDDGYDVFVSGNRAYVGRNSGSGEFAVVDISTPSAPTLVGEYDHNADVNGVWVAGGYAYLATDSTELVVLDLSTESAPTLAGSLDLSGGDDGEAVTVDGTVAYLARESGGELVQIDVSTPSAPALLDAADTPALRSVWKDSDKAFVGTESDDIRIFDVSVSTSTPQLSRTAASGVVTMALVVGDYVYASTEGDPEFQIFVNANVTSVPASFVDDTQGEFDAGTYLDTQFDTDHVELSGTGITNGTGTFTSRVFDATSTVEWTSLSWAPTAPYGKALPGDGESEVGYAAGNADMTGNVLLLHLDEASGALLDDSGQGNTGTASGGPTYGTDGVVADALSFDGADDVVTVADDASLDLADSVTVEGWFDHLGGGGTSAGEIADATLDTLEFDTSNGQYPDIVHVSGDVYAIAYTGSGTDGFLKTVDIDSSGNIGSVIDTLEFDTSNGQYPDIVHVSGDVYAIAYTGSGTDGFLKTVDIDSSGNIGSVIDTLEFDTSNGQYPDIIQVSSNYFAIAYTGSGSDGFVVSVNIDLAGNIAGSVTDSLEFDTSDGTMPDIINVSGDTYAVAYRGSGQDGFVTTFTVSAAGVIGNSTIDTLEFDTQSGQQPRIVQTSSGVYGVAYAGNSNDGFLATMTIDASGNIGNSVIDTLEFDTGDGTYPSIIGVGSGVFAVAYSGPGTDGWLVTVQVSAGGGTLRGGVVKSGAYALELSTSTAYATVNGNEISAPIAGSGFMHLALTYDRTASSTQQRLYVDGVLAASATYTSTVTTNGNALTVGSGVNAAIDEVAVFGRALSAAEILDHYRRGAFDIRFQVRSCDDAACSGESFIGPDGTGTDHYDERDNATTSTPSLTLTNVPDNRYFQYRATLETADAASGPELRSVTVGYLTLGSGGGGGGGGAFASPGTYLSVVLDSGTAGTVWDMLFWTESLPGGTDVTVATRTGETGTPDGSWSAFSSELGDPDGSVITSPAGRYIQYRVTLSTSVGSQTPSLEDITATYFPP